MSMYDQALADTTAILEDSATGFGVPMTLTNPDGLTQEITGHAADIGNTIDPETGQNISGRIVHVSLPTNSLTIGRPKGVPDDLISPWLVELQLPGEATPQTFKIFETMPDRVGVIVCFCEKYTTDPYEPPEVEFVGGRPIKTTTLVHALTPNELLTLNVGDNVDTWPAFAGPDVSKQGTGQPTLTTLSGLPAVVKPNGSYLYDSGTPIGGNKTVFIVASWDAESSSTGLWGQGGNLGADVISFSNGAILAIQSGGTPHAGADIAQGKLFLALIQYNNGSPYNASLTVFVDGEPDRVAVMSGSQWLNGPGRMIGGRRVPGSQGEWSEPIGLVFEYAEELSAEEVQEQLTILFEAWGISRP